MMTHNKSHHHAADARAMMMIWYIATMMTYRQTSYISRILIDNELIDHSDVVRASPVDAAPTTYSFAT